MKIKQLFKKIRNLIRKEKDLLKDYTDEDWKQSNRMIQNLRSGFGEEYVLEVELLRYSQGTLSISPVEINKHFNNK